MRQGPLASIMDVEFMPGAHIAWAADDLALLAKLSRSTVWGKFNGVRLTAAPDTTAEAIRAQYERWLNRQARERKADSNA